MGYTFGDLEVDEDAYLVRRNGTIVEVQPLVFDLIVYLIRHRHRAVSKCELLRQVWRGSTVEDSAIRRCVSLARCLVGDSTSIRTIHARGYQWIAPIREISFGAPELDGYPFPERIQMSVTPGRST